METSTPKKPSTQKTNSIKKNQSVSFYKEKITSNTLIIIAGILFSTILLLVKISWIKLDWKITLIPLMFALQIVFLLSAIKNRYKKL